MLRNQIVSAINAIGGKNFQQVDAAPHYGRIHNYLDTIFPEQWIGRKGIIEWLSHRI